MKRDETVIAKYSRNFYPLCSFPTTSRRYLSWK